MTNQPSQTVLILGAGLAGLTAAYHLARRGHRVTLLDHPAWQEEFQLNVSDTAPILFGCHHETWNLLGALEDGTSLEREPAIPLEFFLPDGHVAAYRSAHLPGALQWMMSLFSFHGLAWHDRWTLFSHLEQIWEQAQTLPADLDSRVADEWLASIGQTPEARKRIWAPLAQWLTGNPLIRLSAATFVRLLSTIFLGQAMHARLTALNGTVGGRFITPITMALERYGAEIKLQPDPPDLLFGTTGVEGIRVRNGIPLTAQWYLAALSHRNLLTLLPEHLLTRYAYFAHLNDLETLSAVTIQFQPRMNVPRPRLLLLPGRPFHQLAITALDPHVISCRLTAIGDPSLMELKDDQLVNLGRSELQALVPDVERDERLPGKVWRQDRAALSLRPGTALLRPIQQSPLKNFLVAGAWTDTGWPANVESAVMSARHCADIIAGHPA